MERIIMPFFNLIAFIYVMAAKVVVGVVNGFFFAIWKGSLQKGIEKTRYWLKKPDSSWDDRNFEAGMIFMLYLFVGPIVFLVTYLSIYH